MISLTPIYDHLKVNQQWSDLDDYPTQKFFFGMRKVRGKISLKTLLKFIISTNLFIYCIILFTKQKNLKNTLRATRTA